MPKLRITILALLASLCLTPVSAEPQGSVSISLEEFLRLQSQKTDGTAHGPPKSFLLSGATYRVTARESWAEVVAEVTLEIKSRSWQEVALLSDSAVLSDTSLNGKPVPVYQKDGKYHLLTKTPGKHRLRLVYKLPLQTSGRSKSFGFTPLDSPVCQLKFVLPKRGLKLESQPPTPIRRLTKSGQDLALLTLPGGAGRVTTLSWQPKGRAHATSHQARLRAKVHTVAQISETAVRCTSQVNYEITGEVEVLRLQVPRGVEVLEVEAPGLSGWKLTDSKGVRQIHAALSRGASGSLRLKVVYEKALDKINTTWELPSLEVQGARSVKGFVALACSGSIEVTPADLEEARLVEPSELPSSLRQGKVLQALKYTAQPYLITLETRKGEEVNVLTASIDSAQVRTLVTREGKVVSTFHYQIRNNRKQYLEFELPPGLTVWSAFVNGQATKPVETESGKVKLALVNSSQGAAFPVELTCVSHSKPGFFLGSQDFVAPAVDVPISSLEWTVFWPEDRSVWSFDTDMQELSAPSPSSGEAHTTRTTVGAGRKGDKTRERAKKQLRDEAKAKEPSNQPVKAPKIEDVTSVGGSSQMNDYRNAALMNMVRTTSLGNFPVRVRVPEAGQPHTFQKLMVTKEMPSLTVRYYDPDLTRALGWGGFLALLAAALGLAGRARRKSHEIRKAEPSDD